MEKNHEKLDPDQMANYMDSYLNAGFTTFDIADHYGSSEIIAGVFKNKHPENHSIQFMTKWVPKPGPINKGIVREAIEKALQKIDQESLEMIQFHAWIYADSSWLGKLDLGNLIKETNNSGFFMGNAFKLGTEMVSAVLVGTIIGFILDSWFGTKPWLIIFFFFVGAAAGILNVIKAAKKMQQK